jgi:hypothetical protein
VTLPGQTETHVPCLLADQVDQRLFVVH